LNLNDPHSVLSLILNAGPVVKVIIAMLLLASLASWTIIFRKKRLLSQAEGEANKFEGTFWSGGDLGKLYRAIGARNRPPVGMESIFEAGFGEFTRLRGQSVPAGELLEGVRRTMRVAQLREIDRLEASRHRRGADRDRGGPLRGHPRSRRLQPVCRQDEPPRAALRRVHGRILDAASAARLREGLRCPLSSGAGG
jgi:hypothetical protein